MGIECGIMHVVEWPPTIEYAESADGTNIAYTVLDGDGGTDVLFAVGFNTNLGVDISDDPGVVRWYERLSDLGRLIRYDQRGTGRSDPIAVNDIPTVQRRVEDMEAVLDAAGVTRAVVIATTSLGAPAMLLAATRPERVHSLVLFGTYARMRAAADYPPGLPENVLDEFVRFAAKGWATGRMHKLTAPTQADNPARVARAAQQAKLVVSPAQADILTRLSIENDVRDALGSIEVPTLVLHRKGDRLVDVAHARYLVEHIPGARLVEFDGEDHSFYAGDVDPILDEIEEFVSGERRVPAANRVLTTVLFVDIVGSTDVASQLGDDRWRALLDQHDLVARRQLKRFQGQLVKSTGDGLMATFDAPVRAVLCACAIRDGVKVLGLDVRAGAHTGEVELRRQDIGGIGVHIAARIADLAGAGQVWVSRTVRDLVIGSGISFEPQGRHYLKGVGEPWELHQVAG